MIFKINSVAVGTRDMPEVSEDLLLSLGEYVETAIEYNNDFLIGKYLKKDTKVITRLHDSNNFDYFLGNHLKYLKRSKVDILLLDYFGLQKDVNNIEQFKKYSETIGLFGEGLSIDDLKEFKEKYDTYPEYISIPLNPYNFKKDLVDFCRETGIKIISHEILGGRIYARILLETFGLQFLARFAAYYSDIVVISSGANLEEEMILSKTLNDLCGDVNIIDETVYELKKDSVKQLMGYRRQVHTYSEVSISGKNHIFKNDNNCYISPNELLLSYQANLEQIPGFDIEELKKSDNVNYETLLIMSDIMRVISTSWKEEIEPFYRYLVMNSIYTIFPRRRYKITVYKIGNVFRITVSDKILFWKKSLEYVLYLSERIDGGYNVFFRNL